MLHSTTFAAREVRWEMSQDIQSATARIADRRPVAAPARNPIIARMDAAAEYGIYDTTEGGLRRNREGMVDQEQMWCQVQTHQGDTLITFYSTERQHSRRILVDGRGHIWLDCDGHANPKPTKYDAPVKAIMRARAH
jgi:hypothetical protein